MEAKARLLYKSYMTYFHTFLPVYFYGMPNGKIYCVYGRLSQRLYSESSLEFLFMEHEDFNYDYELDIIVAYGGKEISHENFKDLVDRPNQRLKTMKLFGNFKSYAEAQDFLNETVVDMINNLELESA